MTKRWIQSADVDISDSGALTVGSGKTYKRAFVDANSSGDNTLVAAVTGKKICVTALLATAKAAVDVYLKSGATAISSLKGLAASAGWVVPAPSDPNAHLYETVAGQALIVNVSAASKGVGVDISYYEE